MQTQHETARLRERARAHAQRSRTLPRTGETEGIDTEDSEDDLNLTGDDAHWQFIRRSEAAESRRAARAAREAREASSEDGPVTAGRSTLFMPGPEDLDWIMDAPRPVPAPSAVGGDLASASRETRPLPTRSRTRRPAVVGSSLVSPWGLPGSRVAGTAQRARGDSQTGRSRLGSVVRTQLPFGAPRRPVIPPRNAPAAAPASAPPAAAAAAPAIPRTQVAPQLTATLTDAQIIEDDRRELGRWFALLTDTDGPGPDRPDFHMPYRPEQEATLSRTRLDVLRAQGPDDAEARLARGGLIVADELDPLEQLLTRCNTTLERYLPASWLADDHDAAALNHPFRAILNDLDTLVGAVAQRAMRRADWFDIAPQFDDWAAEVARACCAFLSRTYVDLRPDAPATTAEVGAREPTDASHAWIAEMRGAFEQHLRQARDGTARTGVRLSDNAGAGPRIGQQEGQNGNAGGGNNAGAEDAEDADVRMFLNILERVEEFAPPQTGETSIHDSAPAQAGQPTTDPLSRSALDLLVETRGVRDGVREFIARLNRQDGQAAEAAGVAVEAAGA